MIDRVPQARIAATPHQSLVTFAASTIHGVVHLFPFGAKCLEDTLQPPGLWAKLVLREVQTPFRFTFEEESSSRLSWLSGRDDRVLRSR